MIHARAQDSEPLRKPWELEFEPLSQVSISSLLQRRYISFKIRNKSYIPYSLCLSNRPIRLILQNLQPSLHIRDGHSRAVQRLQLTLLFKHVPWLLTPAASSPPTITPSRHRYCNATNVFGPSPSNQLLDVREANSSTVTNVANCGSNHHKKKKKKTLTCGSLPLLQLSALPGNARTFMSLTHKTSLWLIKMLGE